MFAFLLGPLVVSLFLIGTVLACAWYFTRRKDRRPRVLTVIAVPIGCAAVPVAGLVLLAIVSSFFQKSDTQLYEEIFGYKPAITEDRMLFDDFDSGNEREIFMRAEPTDAERKRLLAIPNLVRSEITLEQFIAQGAEHGFTWWVSGRSFDDGYCKAARIQEARDFRGWLEFRVAECLDAGTEFPHSENVRNIYVIASHRAN